MRGLLRKIFVEDAGNAWWGKLLLAGTFFLLAVGIYVSLDDIEKSGKEVLGAIAFFHWLARKLGTALIFGVVPGIVFAVWGVRQRLRKKRGPRYHNQ